MKVLVTGGAGYIGSVVTWQLAEAGHEVVVFDNLYQGHAEAVHPRATLVVGDLANREQVEAVMAEHKPTAVMHFASYTLVGESMQLPFKYIGDNVRNGLNLFESALAHGVQKFVLSSTANLFGEPQTLPITEEEPLAPSSPYGQGKYILEQILHWLDVTKGIKYAAFRYFNACGATAELGDRKSVV